MLDKDKLWQSVLAELEIVLPRASFLTWLQNTKIMFLDQDSGEIIVGVSNNFTKEWLEKKYHKTILGIVQNLTDYKIKKIKYQVETAAAPTKTPTIDIKKIIISTKEEPEDKNGMGLNARYTFENFVVGKSNELAYAAAQAAAEGPGKKYNPLFLYGGVGLGKTHLLQAIGHAILKKNPRAKILYTNAERFTNEFVNALRNKTIDKFKTTYRDLDLLLVDDVQFMAGKEGTQEEFFYTFNDLYQHDKQIVLTSDRLPKAIPALEERLVSRFNSGLIADISSPDLETRIAILRSKCQEKKYSLEPEILQYLAVHIQKNVRELEGALSKIMAYHELNKTTPTIESVKQIVSGLTTQSKKSLITIKDIINATADFYGIKVSDLTGTSRRRELVNPRQVAMFLMREELNASFPLIGHEMGGRDHTTAIHSCNKVKEEVENEKRIKQEVDYIKQRLYAQ
jgi:chromosomal replication initiator protein